MLASQPLLTAYLPGHLGFRRSVVARVPSMARFWQLGVLKQHVQLGRVLRLGPEKFALYPNSTNRDLAGYCSQRRRYGSQDL